MFVLTAGPGMGKSVFSAVVHTKLTAQAYQKERGGVGKVILVSHFFKAGQLRAQGLSMIQSLALQLAEALGSSVMCQGVGRAFKSLALFQTAKKMEELKTKKPLDAHESKREIAEMDKSLKLGIDQLGIDQLGLDELGLDQLDGSFCE